ncbi:MAG: acetate/propionate family kinase [Anaerolineae bacterium]|nr:acetate/propionate family kinase [Anaerolineae bacterium]
MQILVFNCGSSSLSYKLFTAEDPEALSIVGSGKAHRVGVTGTEPAFIEHRFKTEQVRQVTQIPNHLQAAKLIFDFLHERKLPVEAIGHRFVHGGMLFDCTTQLTPKTLATLERCLPLAPLHNPNSMTVIRAALEAYPGVPEYATFDTAFHATLPPEASTYALPYAIAEHYGFRKYGFHGLSYQSVTESAARYLNRNLVGLKVIACHLGTGGASAAAIRDGQSIETTMGYSPLPGLIMSTRSGDLDPTVVLELCAQHGYTPTQVTRMLNHESGLLGISGFSSDIRDILRRRDEQGDARAELAFAAYSHRLKLALGSLIAVLGGLDVLIFTDDVGLKVPEVRAAACAGMDWCGIRLDPERNEAAHGEAIAEIGADRVRVLVVPNDEEGIIAAEGLRLLQKTL